MNSEIYNTITNVMFVCHGNICRSPMAEFVLLHLARQKGLEANLHVASAATSTEELGNGVHHGTLRKLSQVGVTVYRRQAVQLKKADYAKYDYIIGMDSANVRNILRITGGDPEDKVYMLPDFTENHRDIADPWYTGDFDTTYDRILEGCTALMDRLFPF